MTGRSGLLRRRAGGGRPGFTLVEMLTVIAILLLLVGLLVPGVQAARDSAHGAECLDHLHYLGNAYSNRRLFVAKPGEAAWAGRWISEFEPYLENSGRVLTCPLSPRGLTGVGSNAKVRVTNVTNLSGGWVGNEIPLQPGNGRCRIHTTSQYASAITSPGGYVLEIEDGTDNDWNDLVLAFNSDPSGQLRFTILNNATSATLALVNPDGSVVLGGLTNNAKNGQGGLLNVPSAVSYGINAWVHRMTQDDHKTLMIDYNKMVVEVLGTGFPDVWPVQVAPRHRGRVNLLFVGGHADSRDPKDIDPRILRQQNQYWQPNGDQL